MTFAASYPGRCVSCHGRIVQGDNIIPTDEGAVHEDCWGEQPEPKRGEVCPECFTEKSLSGVCAC